MRKTVLLLASAAVAVLFSSAVTYELNHSYNANSSTAALASRLEALKSCGADATVTCRAAEGGRSSRLGNLARVLRLSFLRSLKKGGEG
jgi:hypothetical protein